MITWWMASLLANVNIAVVEYMNRSGGYDGFWNTLVRTSPFILLAQYGLYKCWVGAPSFMLAWAFFTMGNLVLRLLSNHYMVGEGLSVSAAAGVCLVVGGVALVKMGAQ